MLTLDPGATALVIVDLQQGIVSLPVEPHTGPEVIGRTVALARALAEAGGLLVAVNVDYSDRYADRPTGLVDSPLALPAEGLPEGWARLVPEIAALPAEVRVTKRHHSAFAGTELDLQFRRRGIRTVVIAGLATNFGVEATARDGYSLDYSILIASDACASTGPGLHDFAIGKVLPRISRVRTTAEILAALRQGRQPLGPA